MGSPYYWRLFLQADQSPPDVKSRAARAYEILTASTLASAWGWVPQPTSGE